MSFIYLASPYTSPSRDVREHRYLITRHFTMLMLQAGKAVFSPIVYGKEMEHQIGYKFENWQALNDAMIKACAQFLVLRLDGWEDSRGIKHELELAKRFGKPITYVDPFEVSR